MDELTALPSAQLLPEVRQVLPGDTLVLCRCGRSPRLPDCAEQCQQALIWRASREQRLLLCRCGASRNLPFCDGRHVRPAPGLRARLKRFLYGQ